MMNKYKLFENLKQNDLEYMISPYASVDQYTAKLNDDNIVIAFFCNDRESVQDLYSFIEKTYVIEVKDIEISDSLTEDNKYILYVELERNQQFPELFVDMIDSINFLINKTLEDWYFVTFGMKQKDKVSIENIKKYVRLTELDIDDNKEVKECVVYSNDKFMREFLDEGYISEKEMVKILENSETLNENSIELEVLEYTNPGKEIIACDNYFFIIGDKIKKLRNI